MDNKYLYKYEDRGIYCYDGSDVLINKLCIKNEKSFQKAESMFAAIRQAELEQNPLPGKFDFEHLKAIHHYLFQDLFSWAGNIRTVTIAKASMFCLPQYIDNYANDIFSRLRNDNYLQDLSKQEFILKLTDLFADINALHPFREGNGRTQREFVRYIAGINGYGLRYELVDPEENIIASHESVNGDNSKLLKIIKSIIYKLDKQETNKFRNIMNINK